MVFIATWNVNSIRTRLDHLKMWCKEYDPDVILLQELKCVKELFPYEEISDMGYNIDLVGQKAYNGVAILSKHPIENNTYNLPNYVEDDQARYIEATIENICFCSVYVPNGFQRY